MALMVEGRVRAAMRASQVVWWMGMFTLLGLLRIGTQIFSTSPLDLEAFPQVISLDEVGDLSMTVADAPLWIRVLSWSPAIVTTAGLAASAFLLSPILVAVAGGQSFGDVARRNLRRIGLVLVISAIAATALEFLAVWQLGAAIAAFRDATQAAGVGYDVIYGTRITIPWLPLALGVIAAAFRWVIHDGAVLEQEVEGVI